MHCDQQKVHFHLQYLVGPPEMAWLIFLLTEREWRSHINKLFCLEGIIFNHAFVGDTGSQPVWHTAGQLPAEVQGDLGPGVSEMPDEGGPGGRVLVPMPPLQDGPKILYITEIQLNLGIDKP